MTKKILVGVAWPYVNGDLHVGHLAGYLLPADIFARFHRFIGNEVLMVSGSDCFGTPITIEADKRGLSPQEVVEEYHAKDVALFQDLGISYDCYTRTDTENHIRTTQDFFVRAFERGFVFTAETEQYFSPREKRFLPDRYVEGTCPHCGFSGARSDQCDQCGRVLDQGDLKEPRSRVSGSTVEFRRTSHYFFDWPKLQPFLREYVERHEGVWRDWVWQETMGWLREGLRPRAITRDLDWGVPIPVDRLPASARIPGSEHKRIYVWFDAVIGYLSASFEWAERYARPSGNTRSRVKKSGGEAWKPFWYGADAEHYYFMGKDNLVFHALFWPGQLYAYDPKIHLPDTPAINHFLNLEGRKFSKSRGVIIDSRYLFETYGADAVRFYIASIMPELHDANFSWSGFVRTTNDVLVGTIGNFINRTLTLACDTRVRGGSVGPITRRRVGACCSRAREALAHARFKEYVEAVMALADFGNKYLSKKEPWKARNHGAVRFHRILSNGMYVVAALSALLKPLLPDATERLAQMVGFDFEQWPDEAAILSALDRTAISGVRPLFSKIDPEVVGRELGRLPLVD